MTSRLATVALATAVAFGAVACREPSGLQPGDSVPKRGDIEVRLGDGLRARRPLAGASCRTIFREGRTFLSVEAPTTRTYRAPNGRTLQPHHLTATLPQPTDGDRTVTFEPSADTPAGAVASLFDLSIGGTHYQMLQLIARKLPDYDRPVTCRWQKHGASATLNCRHAQPFPWPDSTDLPEASFRAEFQCTDSPGEG